MAIQIISNISQIIKICVSINLKKYIKINDFHVSFHNLQFFFRIFYDFSSAMRILRSDGL